MLDLPVKPKFVRRNSKVTLSKDLPLGFGNKFPIRSGKEGYITSEGFELGMLKVNFGKELVQFNVLSAENYLVCDPYSKLF